MDIKQDLSFIIRKSLIQLRINLYTIDLIFENGIIISIANEVVYIEGENRIQIWDSVNNPKFSINKLLGILIVNAKVDEQDNLIIEFRNNGTLIIKSAKDIHESYIINNGDDFQVIY